MSPANTKLLHAQRRLLKAIEECRSEFLTRTEGLLSAARFIEQLLEEEGDHPLPSNPELEPRSSTTCQFIGVDGVRLTVADYLSGNACGQRTTRESIQTLKERRRDDKVASADISLKKNSIYGLKKSVDSFQVVGTENGGKETRFEETVIVHKSTRPAFTKRASYDARAIGMRPKEQLAVRPQSMVGALLSNFAPLAKQESMKQNLATSKGVEASAHATAGQKYATDSSEGSADVAPPDIQIFIQRDTVAAKAYPAKTLLQPEELETSSHRSGRTTLQPTPVPPTAPPPRQPSPGRHKRAAHSPISAPHTDPASPSVQHHASPNREPRHSFDLRAQPTHTLATVKEFATLHRAELESSFLDIESIPRRDQRESATSRGCVAGGGGAVAAYAESEHLSVHRSESRLSPLGGTSATRDRLKRVSSNSSQKFIALTRADTIKQMVEEQSRKETLLKSAKLEFEGNLGKLWCIMPAFDQKGRWLDLDQFDTTDFQDLSFRVSGFHPRSLAISLWDACMVLFYLLCIVMIPFCICFQEPFGDNQVPVLDPSLSRCLSIVYSSIYLIDSVFSFVTPYPSVSKAGAGIRDFELSRPTFQEWREAWFKTQLIYDLVSLIPFDILFETYPYAIYFQILRFPRFHRLPSKLRHNALYKRARVWLDKVLGNGIASLVPIVTIIALAIHVNACVMFMFGKLEGFVGWDIAWVKFQGATISELYSWCFYMTVGNMLPMSFMFHTISEQILGVMSMFIGSAMFATFIGAISAATLSYDVPGRLYNEKLDELRDYMAWKDLSTATQERLIAYYETKYRGKFFEETNLLANMNESLRTEVSLHNARSLIEQVPFLNRNEQDGRDEIWFGRIAAVLTACYYTSGDFITKQGDSGLDMYFILQGKVIVLIDDVKVVSLYDGSYIGEVSLITRSLRSASVQAALPSILYRLTCEDFNTIVSDFDDIQYKIDNLARQADQARKASFLVA
ncbi:hypothetical protein BC830DRAFT_1102119 [Chytriomyces sp. MP71]|nr:hypothetical protein BC830DRAFT_1102119 [Chytriomyces sp. MP71]